MGLLYTVDLVYCPTSNDSHTWIGFFLFLSVTLSESDALESIAWPNFKPHTAHFSMHYLDIAQFTKTNGFFSGLWVTLNTLYTSVCALWGFSAFGKCSNDSWQIIHLPFGSCIIPPSTVTTLPSCPKPCNAQKKNNYYIKQSCVFIVIPGMHIATSNVATYK